MNNDMKIINTVSDIKDFFRTIHGRYPNEWHPDDDFTDFTDENGKRSFTDEEAKDFNCKMAMCFQYCDDNALDIYELAGNVQIEIWKSQGIWKG